MRTRASPGPGAGSGKVAKGEDVGGAGGEDLDGLHGRGCQGTTLSGSEMRRGGL